MSDPNGDLSLSDALDRALPGPSTTTPTEPTTQPDAGDAPVLIGWSLPRRIGFRFLLCYLALWVLPFPLSLVPQLDGYLAHYDRAWGRAAAWVAERLLELDVVATARTGDTAVAYLAAALMAGAALGFALVWSRLSHRPSHPVLARWLRVGLRYYLALALLGAGLTWVFDSRFPNPELERLVAPLGSLTPEDLVWSFFGHSNAYVAVLGAAAVLVAFMLLFRRTATLGALLAGVIVGNALLIALCFDLTTKLRWIHLLAMAVVIAAADRRRLSAFFVRNRAVGAAELAGAGRWRALAIVTVPVKIAVIGQALWLGVGDSVLAMYRHGDRRELPRLYGLYAVEAFRCDGEELPPLLTDERRWRYFVVDRPDEASIVAMDGTVVRARLEIPETGSTFVLTGAPGFDGRPTWRFEQPGPGALVLAGPGPGGELEVELRRVDPAGLALSGRPFRWVAAPR